MKLAILSCGPKSYSTRRFKEAALARDHQVKVLIAVFLFMTAPVSAHLLAKAALHRRIQAVTELPPAEHDSP